MAIARICDNCGEFFELQTELKAANNVLAMRLENTGGMTLRGDTMDVCPDCMKAVEEALKMRYKETHKPEPEVDVVFADGEEIVRTGGAQNE